MNYFTKHAPRCPVCNARQPLTMALGLKKKAKITCFNCDTELLRDGGASKRFTFVCSILALPIGLSILDNGPTILKVTSILLIMVIAIFTDYFNFTFVKLDEESDSDDA